MKKIRVLVVDDDAVLSFCCLLCSPWRFLSLPFWQGKPLWTADNDSPGEKTKALTSS
jgi:hypothetical protein